MKISVLLVIACAITFLGLGRSQSTPGPAPKPSPVNAPSSPVASVPPPASTTPQAPPKNPCGIDDTPATLNRDTWQWIKRGMFIALMLLGLVWCFAGYRLFKPVLFLAGFLAFFFITAEILTTTFGAKINVTGWGWISLAIAAAVGVIGGVLMILVYKIGVFLVGFIAGALLTFLVVAFTPLSNLLLKSVSTVWVFWVFLACVVGIGIAVGAAAIFLVKHVVIVSTAVSGAILVGIGADRIAQQSCALGVFDIMHAVFAGSLPQEIDLTNYATGWPVWLLLSGIIILAVGGAVVQYKFTAKDFSHEPKAKPTGTGEEEFPLLIQSI